MVPPYTPKNKPVIAFVGEAPGADEERLQRPFIGPSGKLLGELCHEAGFEKDDCYITNVVKDRPKNNDISQASPHAYDPYWLNGLRAELERVRPNVVVPLGNVALNAICGMGPDMNWVHGPLGKRQQIYKFAISKYRGSVLESTLVPGLKVIPTVHPAYILRQWHWRQLALVDLNRIREESGRPDISRRKRELILQPSRAQVVDYFNEIIDKGVPFAADIELFGKDLACIGVARSPDSALCVPLTTNEGHYWNEGEEVVIWKALNKLFASKNAKIGQNFLFDLFWLKLYGLNCGMESAGAEIWDTMLMFHTLYCELPKGLDVLTSIFCNGEPYYKDEGKSWLKHVPNTQLWHYNLMDCVCTYEVYERLLEDLEEDKQLDFYKRIPMGLMEPLLGMMMRGVRIDMRTRERAREVIRQELENKQKELNAVAGRELNAGSSKQLVSYFYFHKGLKPKYNRKTGNVTTNELALTELQSKYNLPEFNIILDMRGLDKLKSTYLDNEVDADHRMRCFYNPGGTVSGRLSSSKSPLGTGANLQNFPRADEATYDKEISKEERERLENLSDSICRKTLIPDAGYGFLECDLSQADARVVAYTSGEENLIAAFESGGDIHRYNASILLNKPQDQITKDERYLAKKLVHAANYGIKGQTFADSVNKDAKKLKLAIFFTKQTGNEKIELYYSKFDGIPIWHGEIQRELGETRTLYNLLGRKHVFFDHWGDDLFRAAYSYIPQSTVGDLTNLALIKMHRKYPQFPLALQIHDSIIIQYRIGQLEEAKSAMHDCFDIELEARGRKFKIPIDYKSSEISWGHIK